MLTIKKNDGKKQAGTFKMDVFEVHTKCEKQVMEVAMSVCANTPDCPMHKEVQEKRQCQKVKNKRQRECLRSSRFGKIRPWTMMRQSSTSKTMHETGACF